MRSGWQEGNTHAPERRTLLAQALAVQRFLVGYNILEGLIAISAGAIAGSIALVGFGLDSVIEVTAASMLIWRLSHRGSLEEETVKEKRALHVIGATFFLLALYVLYEAGSILLERHAPEVSRIGLLLAVLSLVMMPMVGLRQRALAKRLKSRALAADATETFICAYLSFALLLGLGLNALWGWWWADPAAALAMLPLILREGWDAMAESREDSS